MEFLVFCPAQRVSHKVTFLKLVSEQEKATCVNRTGGFLYCQTRRNPIYYTYYLRDQENKPKDYPGGASTYLKKRKPRRGS